MERAARLNHDAVIVIFGAAVRPDGGPSATLRRRVEAAFACGSCLASSLYVPTGAKGRYGASEASVMARLLAEHGVKPGQILLEETGTDTLSSVRAVARLVRDHGLTAPVHVATSGYHLPRCLLLLRLAGIDARPCVPPPADDHVWQRWFWRVREAAAIPYDALLMLSLRLARRV